VVALRIKVGDVAGLSGPSDVMGFQALPRSTHHTSRLRSGGRAILGRSGIQHRHRRDVTSQVADGPKRVTRGLTAPQEGTGLSGQIAV
jgi:hypothetical protein